MGDEMMRVIAERVYAGGREPLDIAAIKAFVSEECHPKMLAFVAQTILATRRRDEDGKPPF